ncbi:MAG: class I SAM-dependent methyltransferase [Pseudorhodoplanes sp.]|nr:class I SAM-dependent methyltransferase [Pseudorhodoplanes sp.]
MRAYKTLAAVYAAGRDIPRALYAIMRGLKFRETPQLKAMFVQYVKGATNVPEIPEFREYLVRALSEPWGRPNFIAHTCSKLVKHDPRINAAIRRAAAVWPKRLAFNELFGEDGFVATSRDPLLRALLENGRLPDVATECFLTMVRTEMLGIAASPHREVMSDPAALDFFCALARQCFINEYVFAETESEREVVVGLRYKLAATLRLNGEIDPLSLVAVAAYEPLCSIPDCEALLTRSWPPAVDALLTQQVREPVAERNMRSSIPRLTEVDDGVSALVQQQYEENPYPRWAKTVAAHSAGPIDRNFKAQFPHAPYRPLEKTTVDALIAGCGTGQQVVDLATAITGARVLAVDLSLTSLCYAKCRTDAMGLTNVDYGQADILKLGSLGRSFDVIACTGVLHHLRDPLEGWRTLLSLLRPNGLMQIALYSETARASIVAARNFIAEKGYGVGAEDIRRCRQDIMRLDVRSPIAPVAMTTDFFGTSDCRDLLFHVQEHRFTIPKIKAFLAENGLQFLGFFTADPLIREYPKMFPDDLARINLDNWHEFEQRHPMAFASMYQFWVQKQD